MAITLDDLTVDVSHLDCQRLLDSWRWLISPSKHPILVTALGDAFVQDELDGSVHLLDTAAGTCSPVAAGPDELRALLGDGEFVMEYLVAAAVADFIQHGLRLQRGQVYSWQQPPVLGGEYELANAGIADVEVHFALTGQIHEQVAGLPPGTPIQGIRTDLGGTSAS